MPAMLALGKHWQKDQIKVIFGYTESSKPVRAT